MQSVPVDITIRKQKKLTRFLIDGGFLEDGNIPERDDLLGLWGIGEENDWWKSYPSRSASDREFGNMLCREFTNHPSRPQQVSTSPKTALFSHQPKVIYDPMGELNKEGPV